MLHTQLSKANLMAFMAWWPDGTRPLLGIPSVLPAASHVSSRPELERFDTLGWS